MTLRQFYKAITIMEMQACDKYDPGQETPEQRAKLAGIEADAMIAEDEEFLKR